MAALTWVRVLPFHAPRKHTEQQLEGTGFCPPAPGALLQWGRPDPAHLVSLLLGGGPPMVDHLGRQEVELDVWVGDPGLAPDEATCFQMGRGSIP